MYLLNGDAELLDAVGCLRCERLVDLEHINVVQGEASLLNCSTIVSTVESNCTLTDTEIALQSGTYAPATGMAAAGPTPIIAGSTPTAAKERSVP